MDLSSQTLQQQLFHASREQYQRIKNDLTPWFFEVFQNPVSQQNGLRSAEQMLVKEAGRLRKSGKPHSKRQELRDIFILFHIRELGRYHTISSMNPAVRKLFRRVLSTSIYSGNAGEKNNNVLSSLASLTFLLPGVGNQPEQDQWLMNQLKQVQACIPDVILDQGAFGKVYRTIMGVMMYAYSALPPGLTLAEQRERLFRALQGGFHYGLLYPLVDDVFDTKGVLSNNARKQFVEVLNHWIGGDLKHPNPWPEDPSMNRLLQLAHDLNLLFPVEQHPEIYQAFYILHFAQIEDLQKTARGSYTAEEVYIPLIIKAAYSRIIAAWLGGIQVDEQLHGHLLKLGLYFQLHDDLRDWKSDADNDVFTPFTHFLKSSENGCLPNPLDIMLVAVDEFTALYDSVKEAERIILGRFSRTFARMVHGVSQKRGLQWVIRMTPDKSIRQKLLTELVHRADSITDPDEQMMAMFERVIGSQFGHGH